MRPRIFPAVPIGLLFASLLIVTAGLVSDFEPPAPVGELRPATVLSVHEGGLLLVRVDTPAGPSHCYVDGPASAPFSETTVDYSPSGCRPPPVSKELPRSGVLALGIGGVLVTAFWLWAGRRAGF